MEKKMNLTNLSNCLITGMAGFVIGVVIVFYYTGSSESRLSMPKQFIADCTTGQDKRLRKATGTATFRVQFQDGEFVSNGFECISKKSD
ncbi:MAG: hypothetical protein JKX80_00030 [Candidatus Pacebacteria bacterium]|nr:hypothetical protein [Candidatus Paceibacterota bacterium]